MCVFNRFSSRDEFKKIRVMEDVNKFYEWMLKMGNIHLANNEEMSKAFIIVAEN
ncbi:hypothetical protein UFOVP54_107 [uncultured Caudovirales phage]|uniref:Uncharacterized protein n=1 Tax=uncultured Caudovirales phage TaxID=2100421 RepID=A0A6J5KTT5_9CAUD|nr:hypothetical protein UFOVP54_107 [uncultured Caudovirales phage]